MTNLPEYTADPTPNQADRPAETMAQPIAAAAEQVESQLDRVANRAEAMPQALDRAADIEANRIEAIKDTLTQPLPTPPKHQGGVASAADLLNRLKWGEPALTIIDVRDREAFNAERITGAISMPMDQLTEGAESSLERDRDIYLYGDSADQAADQLRAAGFVNVAPIQGGLAAWKAIDGATEGQQAFSSPTRS
jgi:rhodanese-related sulfurtransferase